MKNKKWKDCETYDTYANDNGNTNSSELCCPFCGQTNPEILGIDNSNSIANPNWIIQCECLNKSSGEKYKAIKLSEYKDYWAEKSSILNTFCFTHQTRTTNILCSQCNIYLCQSCLAFHNETLSNHAIMTVNNDGVITNSISNKTVNTCKSHPNAELSWYCETCNMNICPLCAETSHFNADQHYVITLKQMWEETAAKIPFNSVESVNEYISTTWTKKIFYWDAEKSNFDDFMRYIQWMRENYDKWKEDIFHKNETMGVILWNTYSTFWNSKLKPNYNNIKTTQTLAVKKMCDRTNLRKMCIGLEKWSQEIKNYFEMISGLIDTSLIKGNGVENTNIKGYCVPQSCNSVDYSMESSNNINNNGSHIYIGNHENVRVVNERKQAKKISKVDNLTTTNRNLKFKIQVTDDIPENSVNETYERDGFCYDNSMKSYPEHTKIDLIEHRWINDLSYRKNMNMNRQLYELKGKDDSFVWYSRDPTSHYWDKSANVKDIFLQPNTVKQRKWEENQQNNKSRGRGNKTKDQIKALNQRNYLKSDNASNLKIYDYQNQNDSVHDYSDSEHVQSFLAKKRMHSIATEITQTQSQGDKRRTTISKQDNNTKTNNNLQFSKLCNEHEQDLQSFQYNFDDQKDLKTWNDTGNTRVITEGDLATTLNINDNRQQSTTAHDILIMPTINDSVKKKDQDKKKDCLPLLANTNLKKIKFIADGLKTTTLFDPEKQISITSPWSPKQQLNMFENLNQYIESIPTRHLEDVFTFETSWCSQYLKGNKAIPTNFSTIDKNEYTTQLKTNSNVHDTNYKEEYQAQPQQNKQIPKETQFQAFAQSEESKWVDLMPDFKCTNFNNDNLFQDKEIKSPNFTSFLLENEENNYFRLFDDY